MTVTGIDTKAKWRDCMEARWDRSRTLLGGTDAMRKARERYLPKFPEEEQTSYEYRLNLATLNNFYRRMARTMMGYLFSDPVELEDCQLPEDFLENVDLRGSDINQFARQVGWHMLTRGLAVPLVDYPVIPAGLNLKQERELNARPYLRTIVPDSLISGFAKDNKGVETISHMRWLEVSAVPDGWDEACVERIRVLDTSGTGRADAIKDAARLQIDIGSPDQFLAAPVVYMVWVSNQGGWELQEAGEVRGVDQIPLTVVYAEREGFMLSRPPLDDVAYKNVHHWRKSSDLEHILELSAFPTEYQCGTAEPVKTVGPSILLHSTEKDAKFGYIEPTGSGVTANERALDRIVAEAEMLGFQLLKPSVGTPQTATGRVLDETKSTSPLQEMALALEDGLTSALRIASKWYGLTEEAAGKAVVSKNFGVDPEMFKRVDAILKQRAQGDLSLPTMFEMLIDAGLYPKDLDVKKEIAQIEEEARDSFQPDAFAGNQDPNNSDQTNNPDSSSGQ